MRRLTMIVIWALLVLGGIFAIVRFSGLLDHMLAAGDPPDFIPTSESPLPATPNYFLACPADMMPPTTRKMESPVFATSRQELAAALVATAPDHGMTLMDGNENTQILRFLARSTIFRFPDWVEIRLQPGAAGDGVTFCMFAQSVFGHDDLGQNKKRTRAWIRDFRARLGKEAPGDLTD